MLLPVGGGGGGGEGEAEEGSEQSKPHRKWIVCFVSPPHTQTGRNMCVPMVKWQKEKHTKTSDSSSPSLLERLLFLSLSLPDVHFLDGNDSGISFRSEMSIFWGGGGGR